MEQFNKRSDTAAAALFDPIPLFRSERLDRNRLLVEVRSLHECGDLSRLDGEAEDGAIAHVGAPSREAIFKIPERLKMVTPGLPPETRRDLEAMGKLTQWQQSLIFH